MAHGWRTRTRRTLAAPCASLFGTSPSFSECRRWTESSTSKTTLSLQGSRRDGRPGCRASARLPARARKHQQQRKVALGRPAVGGWLPTSIASSLWATLIDPLHRGRGRAGAGAGGWTFHRWRAQLDSFVGTRAPCASIAAAAPLAFLAPRAFDAPPHPTLPHGAPRWRHFASRFQVVAGWRRSPRAPGISSPPLLSCYATLPGFLGSGPWCLDT